MSVSPPTSSVAVSNDAMSPVPPHVSRLAEHTVEIVSDSGEGAQKCGQIFGRVSARMGNGVWTVEIIPAEIQPPARTPASVSGNRVRVGTAAITNRGDAANLVVAFNEQVLLARHRLHALAADAIVLIAPMEEQCLTVVDEPRRGKNMFALGLLARIYDRDADKVRQMIADTFRRKSEEVYERNVKLFELGCAWAESNLDFRFDVPPSPSDRPMVVMNGNQAFAIGAIAAGMEFCAMYPITPAASVSHHLGEIFERHGGIVHQAEDEIAAIGVAIGASYAGKTAFTITSGPGLALKTEFIGLAVMTEIPLVLVNVQRGGPSTGMPTKVEQADLLAAIFGQPGDAPHVVIAPASIEGARRLEAVLRPLCQRLLDCPLHIHRDRCIAHSHNLAPPATSTVRAIPKSATTA